MPATKSTKSTSVTAKYEKQGTGPDAKFYRVRANGSKRRVPVLTGDALATAKAIKAEREGENPRTMKQIAIDRHLSVATVRRYLTSLSLTEAVQAQADRTAKGQATRAAKAAKVQTA